MVLVRPCVGSSDFPSPNYAAVIKIIIFKSVWGDGKQAIMRIKCTHRAAAHLHISGTFQSTLQS